jgi:hypothetical protein
VVEKITEVRAPIRIKARYLSIEHSGAATDIDSNALRKRVKAEPVAVAREKSAGAFLSCGKRAKSVVLDLEEPSGSSNGSATRPRSIGWNASNIRSILNVRT